MYFLAISLFIILVLGFKYLFEKLKTNNPRDVLKKNEKKLIEFKNILFDYRVSRQKIYKNMFFSDVDHFLLQGKEILPKLSYSSKKTFDKIISVYNHKTIMFLIKKGVDTSSKKIYEDFNNINDMLAIPYKEIVNKKRNESLKHIYSKFDPIISSYDSEINSLIISELKLIEVSRRFFENEVFDRIEKLKKPGFFKKIKYYFSSSSEKKDLRILEKLKQELDEYLFLIHNFITCWGCIQKTQVRVKIKFDAVFNEYLSFLFEECTFERTTDEINIYKKYPGTTIKKLTRAMR